MSYAESEDRKLMFREVKALESIAKSLDRLVKKYENPNLPARDINNISKDNEEQEYYVDPESEGLFELKAISSIFAIPIYSKAKDRYALNQDTAIAALTIELKEAFSTLKSGISFDYLVLKVRKFWKFPDECFVDKVVDFYLFVDVDFYLIDEMVYTFTATKNLYSY